MDLPDVNVWLALAHPGHTHHAAAKAYWQEASAPLAFCRTSMLGFLRLVTQAAVMGPAVHTAAEAWSIYSAHLAGGRTLFLQEPASLEAQMRQVTDHADFRPRDWTDAYLASFALAAPCRMVSFDGGFTQYQRRDGLDFLLLEA
jgi:toxin-antitoxin system PIN domain toxin